MLLTSTFAVFGASDQSAYEDLNSLIHNSFIQALLTVLIAIVAQIIVRDFISRIVARAVRRHRYTSKIEEDKRIRTLSNVLRAGSAFVLLILAVISILAEFHVNLAALLTGAGLISVVIGFGAQSLIKDFLGGIFVILENQYRIDDIITLRTAAGQEVSGAVEDISLRVTKLRDLDGNVHWVSNGSNTVVTNSSSKFANVNLNVHVGYESDIAKVEQVSNEIGQALLADETWKPDIIEPIKFLWVASFDDYAVTVKFLGKVKPGRQFDVASEFRRRLLAAFKTHRINVPLAQVVAAQKKA